MTFTQRLAELELTLPVIPENFNSYTPIIQSGDTLYVSGQIPKLDGVTKFQGRLGESLSIEEGQDAAKLAALNVLAQIERFCGLDSVKQFLKLQVYIVSTPDFGQHPLVANAASDLLIDVFGDAGKHARTSFGCYSLPQGVAVEIDAVIQVKGQVV